jgi:hypothetical protein
MISAYRAGQVAGSAAARAHTGETDARDLAQVALADRKAKGVAHLIPEEEFVSGFLNGFRLPVHQPDGLQLFVDRQ